MCSYQLSNYWLFKKNVIISQSNLYKLQNKSSKNQEANEILFVAAAVIKEDVKNEMEEHPELNENCSDIGMPEPTKNISKYDENAVTVENYLANAGKRKQPGKTG